jgi:hypothetical protein
LAVLYEYVSRAKEIREKYNITLYKKHVGDDIIDCVKYDCDDEKTHIDNIRKIRILEFSIAETTGTIAP